MLELHFYLGKPSVATVIVPVSEDGGCERRDIVWNRRGEF